MALASDVGMEPTDLSLGKSATENDADDVIMLSSSDEEDNTTDDLFPVEVEDQNVPDNDLVLINRLKEELRNEESKLILFKKIKLNQTTVGVSNTNNQASAPKGTTQVVGTKHPIAILRHGQNTSAPIQNGKSNPLKQRPSVSGYQLFCSEKLRSFAHLSNHRERNMAVGRLWNNLSEAERSRYNLQAEQLSKSYHAKSSNTERSSPVNFSTGASRVNQQQATKQSSNNRQNVQNQSEIAQRQIAAKMALRKQLEKTLLQIPSPVPPTPEMNFMPSLLTGEFLWLLGLEDVIKILLAGDKGSVDVRYVFNPFTCVQCGTDFTPVWKRDKPGSKHVICEQCVTTNQKRTIKQEHTARLKQAFVKALQQEQELEKLNEQTVSESKATLAQPPPPLPSTPPATVVNTSSKQQPNLSLPFNMAAASASSLPGCESALQQVLFQQAQLQLLQQLSGASALDPNLISQFTKSLNQLAPASYQQYFQQLASAAAAFQSTPSSSATGLNAKGASNSDSDRKYLLEMLSKSNKR